MKKTIVSIILTIVLCLTSGVNTMALGVEHEENANQYSLSFNDADFIGLSGAELGKAKLLASGHSEGYINSMPNSTLEKIADSENGYQTKSYLTEVLTDSGIELVETTASVFERSLLSAKTIDPNSITVVDEDGNVLHEGENTVLPNDVTVDVNGGTVMILTSFYSVEDVNQPSHFLMVSEFLWTSMPNYRGTDFLGMTRDSATSIIPGTFGNYYAYESDRYWYFATTSGVAETFMETTHTEQTNLPNAAAENPIEGFAIEIDVPGDVNPPLSMVVHTSAYGHYRYALRGGCYFEGVLKYPSIVPTNFNMWTTYLHQKSTTWFSSPSVSVPLGASITVSPQASYSDPIVDPMLITWGSN